MALKTWTKKQIRILKEQYPYCKDVRTLAKKLNKTYSAVKTKATVLKIFRGHISKWTPAMDAILIEKYPNTSVKNIVPILRNMINQFQKAQFVDELFNLNFTNRKNLNLNQEGMVEACRESHGTKE